MQKYIYIYVESQMLAYERQARPDDNHSQEELAKFGFRLERTNLLPK
jgi:hypothetical protein